MYVASTRIADACMINIDGRIGWEMHARETSIVLERDTYNPRFLDYYSTFILCGA